MRLVALPPNETGKVDAILEIAPDEGWHTYWRAPGNGGIPPRFTLEDGGNLKLSTIQYPPPEIITYDDLSDYGYTSTVRFPLELQTLEKGVPSTLKLDAFVGVCADICVPFQAELEVKLPAGGAPDAREQGLVRAARAQLPEQPGPDFSVESYKLSTDQRSLNITVKLPANANAENVQVLAYDGAQAFKPGRMIGAQDGTITVALEPNYLPEGETLSGHTIGILTNTGLRAMETGLELR